MKFGLMYEIQIPEWRPREFSLSLHAFVLLRKTPFNGLVASGLRMVSLGHECG